MPHELDLFQPADVVQHYVGGVVASARASEPASGPADVTASILLLLLRGYMHARGNGGEADGIPAVCSAAPSSQWHGGARRGRTENLTATGSSRRRVRGLAARRKRPATATCRLDQQHRSKPVSSRCTTALVPHEREQLATPAALETGRSTRHSSVRAPDTLSAPASETSDEAGTIGDPRQHETRCSASIGGETDAPRDPVGLNELSGARASSARLVVTSSPLQRLSDSQPAHTAAAPSTGAPRSECCAARADEQQTTSSRAALPTATSGVARLPGAHGRPGFKAAAARAEAVESQLLTTSPAVEGRISPSLASPGVPERAQQQYAAWCVREFMSRMRAGGVHALPPLPRTAFVRRLRSAAAGVRPDRVSRECA